MASIGGAAEAQKSFASFLQKRRTLLESLLCGAKVVG
jgi:hypothetical protein